MDLSNLKQGEIDTGDVRLSYLDWGGSGGAIVLLHCTGSLGRIYRPVAQALTAIGHVFTYDQRGHGDSGMASSAVYDWQATVDDLAAFIEKMNLGRVRAFGHSAGATAVAALAADRPDLIYRAVLAEPVLFSDSDAPDVQSPDPLVERTLKRKRLFDNAAAMFANFENKPAFSTWRKDILRDYCEFGTRTTPDGKRELKCAPEVEARVYATSRNFDGLRRLLRCTIPLMVIFGEKSDMPSRVFSDRIAASFTSRESRVITLPNLGHFMPMESPEELSRLALNFLGSG